jgi:diguanylate cyclase
MVAQSKSAMSQNPGSEEAVRWKKKFLDALEDNEKREQSLQTRIRLLRRGLLGVSLAGDGLDPDLDAELGRLRKALRNEDSEAGLEGLLEQIEQSVLRLDNTKAGSIALLELALAASAQQLENTSLSRSVKKELRRFVRALPAQITDTRGHPSLFIEFLALLREAVRELACVPDKSLQEPSGFWRSLLFGRSGPASAVAAPIQAPVPPTIPMAIPDLQASVLPPQAMREDPEGQPGFSFIARHVEPVLLRILENTPVSGSSAELAGSVRQRISAGLNWYDFAAVLEDMAAIVARTIDQERSSFGTVLNDIHAGLEHVQSYMQASSLHQQLSRDAGTELDQAVRTVYTNVGSLAGTVSDASDLDGLKQTVQGQLDTLLQAVDGFHAARRAHDQTFEQERKQLADRLASLEEEASQLRDHLARQQSQAAIDILTGLPNRGAYDRRLREALSAAPRSLCLAIADVDNFKSINDSYGHAAGDKVLRIIAREIATQLRAADLVARYGGEEFVIVMQDVDNGQAIAVLQKLRETISGIPFHFKERQVQITMSFGVAMAAPEDSAESLFERADQAMYQAKAGGRNCCVSAGGGSPPERGAVQRGAT